MGFTLLGRRTKLVIFAPIDSTVNNIGRSIVYTTLEVNNRVKNNYQCKISIQWLHQSCLFINKISIIDSKLFSSLNKKRWKARKTTPHTISVFGRRLLIVIIGDFYQFASVLGKALWGFLYS